MKGINDVDWAELVLKGKADVYTSRADRYFHKTAESRRRLIEYNGIPLICAEERIDKDTETKELPPGQYVTLEGLELTTCGFFLLASELDKEFGKDFLESALCYVRDRYKNIISDRTNRKKNIMTGEEFERRLRA